MAISRKEVDYVANLSRLKLSGAEIETYTKQLDAILELAKKLDELDTSNVTPTSHALNLENVFREDNARESWEREAVLKNAPEHKDGQFKVPPVMEE